MRLDNNANEIATKKTCPNNRSGSNPDRFKTANPPAVVIAAPAIALPVVTVVLDTHTSGVLRGLACLSSSWIGKVVIVHERNGEVLKRS